MAKKKRLDDIYYPVPLNCISKTEKQPMNKEVIRQIIQGAIKGAYRLKNPNKWDYHGNPVKAKAVATQEQVTMVMHLIESLEPTNAIEAALASQFAITYVRGMAESSGDYATKSMLELFNFSHQVLDAYQKFRTKGAQLINVQYNHNQGQINNINFNKKDNLQPVIEV